MKQRLLVFLSPFLYFFLKRVIQDLKPLFLREDDSLIVALCRRGFHFALCTHPSIVFGYRDENAKGKTSGLRAKVRFLKKCIRIGLLKTAEGHRLMEKMGVQPYYGSGVAFWFEESHFPIRPYHIPDTSIPEGKIAVYTVLTGDYDDVHEILYKESRIDYLLFTNNSSIKSKTWKVILVDSELDKVLLSRNIKMLPHKYLDEEYETSIYVDANAVIYGEITNLTRYLHDGKSLAVSRHSVRTTVKDEIEACVKMRGTNRAEAEEQYNTYLREGFKDEMPLLECGILVRRHKDERLQQLMQTWFEEFKNGVKRDQLSLLPCIHRLSYNDYTVMDGNVWHNQFNRITSHRV